MQGYDIVGDVHGCYDELIQLIHKLGYVWNKNALSHPHNRKIIFVGDLVDLGPASDKVLDFVIQLKAQNIADCVIGNHDNKLYRKLLQRDVQLSHGLEKTLEQLAGKEYLFPNYIEFLGSLPPYLIYDEGRLIITHAAFDPKILEYTNKKIQQYCMYGPTEKTSGEDGLPKRIDWAKTYNGGALIVYGHTVTDKAEIINNTACIDTGCVFGGKLTAMQYPEKQFVSVDAKQQYYQRTGFGS